MSAERVERRLAAILAAAVGGYSRVMGQDESGTLARLRTHRRQLIGLKTGETLHLAVPRAVRARADEVME